MRKFALVALLVFILIAPSYAKVYESSFGFTVDVPGHWLVMTAREFRENPDLINFDRSEFGNVNKDLIKNVADKIRSGQIEAYINKKTSDNSFADNINVLKQAGAIPENKTRLRETCNSLPGDLSAAFGKKVKLYECKLVSKNNLKTLFLDFDGVIQGTRSIQYQIQKSPSVMIIVTATCKNSSLDAIRKEFDRIVFSIKM
jgi:hypothetical protein